MASLTYDFDGGGLHIHDGAAEIFFRRTDAGDFAVLARGGDMVLSMGVMQSLIDGLIDMAKGDG